MVPLVFAALLILLAQKSPLHPEALALLTGSEASEIQCSPQLPGRDLEAPGPQRTTNFSLGGTYECHRPVFSSQERAPAIDRSLQAESLRAKQVAASLAQLLNQQPKGKKIESIGVSVEGGSPDELREQIAALYRNELSLALGPGRIQRRPSEQTATVVVQLRKADVPDLLSKARLRLRENNREVSWQDL